MDDAGNSFVVGTFQGSATIGPQTITAPSGVGVFIAKCDVSGATQWARSVAWGPSITPHGITVTDDGRIGIVGLYLSSAIFGGTDTIHEVAAFDVFTALFDPAGDLIWARSIGDIGFDYGAAIDHDSQGNLYVHGEFHISSFNASSARLFVAKFDDAGDNVWTTLSASNGDFHLGNAISVDGAGNSFITGQFFAMLTLGPFTLDPGNPEAQVYVAKLDTDGNFMWAQQAGAGGYGAGTGIGLDAHNNVYITGFRKGTMAFGEITLPGPGDQAYHMFVAKCDSADGSFAWATGATVPAAGESDATISVSAAGDCYVAGRYFGAVTWGSTTLPYANGGDVFVAKLTTAGVPVWAAGCGGPAGEGLAGIASNGADAFVAGYYFGQAQFDAMTLPGQDAVSDAFVAKLEDATVSGLAEIGSDRAVIFPDPTRGDFSLRGLTGAWSYAIMDGMGRITQRGGFQEGATIRTEGLPPGIYCIRLVPRDKTGQIKSIQFVKE